MSLSVIIPTLNRAADLGRTLSTLLAQTIVPEEIVIVDQTQDDSARRVVKQFSVGLTTEAKQTPRMIYLYHPGLFGVGAARNIAIEQATGDILVFLDDDVLLEADFLAELLAVYQQDPHVGGVSGVVTNYPLPSERERFMDRLFRRGPFHDERQPIYWNCEKLRQTGPFPARKFGGGLMSLTREALDGERFDSQYKGAGSEDIDLSWRVSERWRLVITPRARLIHVRTDSGRPRDHWFTYAVKCDYYSYRRLWNNGIEEPPLLCVAELRVYAACNCLQHETPFPRPLARFYRRGQVGTGTSEAFQRTAWIQVVDAAFEEGFAFSGMV